MGLREDAHSFFEYFPFLLQYLIFTSQFPIFLFYSALMTLPRKGFFSSLSKFFTPFAQSTIGNAKISGYLCFTLPTGFKKIHSLLLEFFGVGRLRFACATLHDNHHKWETCHSLIWVRRRIELNYRGKFPVGGNGQTSEAEATACVRCRYTGGMKPVKVVAQVAYVLAGR